MHVALIATRVPVSPPSSIIYGNRFLAITTTMSCIVICREAMGLLKIGTTNPSQNLAVNALALLYAQLYKQYHLLVNQSSAIVSANLNSILPIYTYEDDGAATLSTLILITRFIAGSLYGVLQAMAVIPERQFLLVQLQQRLLGALAIFQSLALPTNQLQPPQ